jgi:flagellar hook-associated protein 3 FlgL
MLGQANQVVQGRPLFGGVSTGSRAYDDTGAYVGVGDGTDGRTLLTRRVSDVETIRVDLTGPEAFGDPADGDDLFAVIARIADNVLTNPDALSTDLADLDTVMARMTTAAADVGTRAARLQDADAQNSSQSLNLQSKLSDTEDIDMAKTIMNLQIQQNGYQAALSATAKSLSPSLVEFLK